VVGKGGGKILGRLRKKKGPRRETLSELSGGGWGDCEIQKKWGVIELQQGEECKGRPKARNQLEGPRKKTTAAGVQMGGGGEFKKATPVSERRSQKGKNEQSKKREEGHKDQRKKKRKRGGGKKVVIPE